MSLENFTDNELALQLAEALATNDTTTQQAISTEADRRDQQPRATTLQSALWYANKGIRVIPLRPSAKFPPLFKDWPNRATLDPNEIEAWWGNSPRANIGLVTGEKFDVIDIDGPLGHRTRIANWEQIFSLIDEEAIGKVITPRGLHIYVPPEPGRRNSAGILPGVDIRAGGGYVAAPPSATADGTYTWLGQVSL